MTSPPNALKVRLGNELPEDLSVLERDDGVVVAVEDESRRRDGQQGRREIDVDHGAHVENRARGEPRDLGIRC